MYTSEKVGMLMEQRGWNQAMEVMIELSLERRQLTRLSSEGAEGADVGLWMAVEEEFRRLLLQLLFS